MPEAARPDKGVRDVARQAERYDFVVPKNRLGREPLQRFLGLLRDDSLRARLAQMGFAP